MGCDQSFANLRLKPYLVIDSLGSLLKALLLFPLTPIEQAANDLVVHVDRLICKFLGCVDQKRHEQRLTLSSRKRLRCWRGHSSNGQKLHDKVRPPPKCALSKNLAA